MIERRKSRLIAGTALATGAILAVALASPAYAGGHPGNGSGGDKTGTSQLTKAVKVDNVLKHLQALQKIADANGGNRAAGTPGHVAAASYIEKQLQKAGYTTTRQAFSYDKINVLSTAMQQTAPVPTDYVSGESYADFEYTGEGDATALVEAVDVNLVGDHASTSGCEPEDFATFTAGSIALIQRGSCDFAVKAANAIAAGAVGVLIFNQGNVVEGDDRLGLIAGTLGSPDFTVPVFGTTYALGAEFAGTEGLTLRLQADTETTTIDTFNVLADTKGDANKKVVVGAHLDSVPEGPGINDNGSGSAAILETAIQLSKQHIKVKNQIRFAFWSGEEDGLIGSDYYVSQLDEAGIAQHLVNLNFDMVGSPNPVRFVYDGDGDAFGEAGPEGSAEIEKVFNDYFAGRGLATAPTAFDGRSDYFGFINAGIPAGGLFTGAEDLKSEEEAAIFGGTAGVAYDACYHSACDTIANIDRTVLDEMSDAIAHATLTYGEQKRGRGHHGGGWQHGNNGHGHGGHGNGGHGGHWGS